VEALCGFAVGRLRRLPANTVLVFFATSLILAEAALLLNDAINYTYRMQEGIAFIALVMLAGLAQAIMLARSWESA
jgi:hypothetical protein